jgi:hypothetical protein
LNGLEDLWAHQLGTNLSPGLASIHMVNLSTATSRSVKPPSTFLKGPKRSRSHTVVSHVMGMV